jgi:stearoyl-CoA desaturase (Delta-9 desaturase)
MSAYLNGLIDLPWWGYVVVTLALTHITIASVTIFCTAPKRIGRSICTHLVSHFFRFWLWFTTATVTKAWVAIHRKHHAKCETPEDPHSPQIRHQQSALAGRRAVSRRSQSAGDAGSLRSWHAG